MSQDYRVAPGLVDRSTPLEFTFNGKTFQGYSGDTVASALLANGQHLVGRSFKYHRPRGIFSAGSEEPNALVQLRRGAFQEPNTRATVAELFAGLEATSQNHVGSLEFDLMAATGFFSNFLSAGFYYKTFMWPAAFWEKFYEPFIRNSAGLGRLSMQEDPDQYDKGFLHCDVLIIGAGPAGLAAALTAGRTGASVIIADEDSRFGGRLNAETHTIDGTSGAAWADTVTAELKNMDNVRVMPRTTVYGAYDHGIYGALERKTDHLPTTGGKPRQVLWRIYSKRAILAAGATERPIGFGNNDRPGIMLAGAVRAYVNRWGVSTGKRVTLFTNNDDGWRTARDLIANGIEITAIIDSRNNVPHDLDSRVEVFKGVHVADSCGRLRLNEITLSNGHRIKTDCLAVSGGWNPNIHLTCHQRSRPKWDESLSAFVPGDNRPVGMQIAGAANGTLSLAAALKEGIATAATTLKDLDIACTPDQTWKADDEKTSGSAFWYVKESKAKAWVDLQNDVTVQDIRQAYDEGFRSVEHLKRYTTLGMATDQGKTSNITGLAVLADCSGESIPDTGTTIFRPPYTPVSFGALAGRSRGKNFRPYRHPPSHAWAVEQGAVFVEAGLWLRAQWFPRQGETHWLQSVNREVTQVRRTVGICDVSTLGKIDVQGRDAGDFLDKVYANRFSTLKVGKVRYGIMLREDGMVMDDGTTARLGDNHFVVTTTTTNAASVFRHLEFCRQCLWPEMDVHLVSATDAWAQFSIAGPKSRALLQKIVGPAHDISNESFPYMACAELAICGGIPARLFRISFSGELAYEIAVPSRHGDSMVRALIAEGAEFDVVPYGTEALGVMRVEKGHVAGSEMCGRTTARDLGLGRMVSKVKDCIGNTLSQRPHLIDEKGPMLVGFKPVDQSVHLSAGSHFFALGASVTTENDQGWMSSVAFSPTLGHSIGLGLIDNGSERMGEIVRAVDSVRSKDIEVEIVSPHFFDPQGDRLRG